MINPTVLNFEIGNEYKITVKCKCGHIFTADIEKHECPKCHSGYDFKLNATIKINSISQISEAQLIPA